MIIAIDGPAGAGKGTLSQNLVAKYGFKYLDTGALFRAVAINLIKDETLNDENIALKAEFYSKDLDFDFTNDFRIILNGQDVSSDIRDPKTSMIASKVASIPQVRINLDDFQKDFARKYRAKGVILDGRDIGTFIAPDAKVKIFLDCPAEIRATRRVEQLHESGKEANYAEILDNIIQRDKQDRSRNIRPMIPADDAITIDTSKHNAEDVLAIVAKNIDTIKQNMA